MLQIASWHVIADAKTQIAAVSVIKLAPKIVNADATKEKNVRVKKIATATATKNVTKIAAVIATKNAAKIANAAVRKEKNAHAIKIAIAAKNVNAQKKQKNISL